MGHEASTLQPQVMADLQDETGLSAEQIRQYYKTFLSECKGSRMSINEDDFKKYYSEVFPRGDAESFAGFVFNALDTDGSGRIDFREFIMAVSITQTGSEKDKLSWIFDIFDIDGTGVISRAELIEMIQTLRSLRRRPNKEDEPSPEELADYLLSQADSNDDKRLSRKEFISGVKCSQTMFTLIDAAHTVTMTPLKRKLTM